MKIEKLVIFFGGDIQNPEYEMQHSESSLVRQFAEFSLEATSLNIYNKFAAQNSGLNTAVFAVCPRTFTRDGLSFFANFVSYDANREFQPEFCHPSKSCLANPVCALEHLSELITSSLSLLLGESCRNEEISIIDLIGFSKGGTVLTRILYELSWRNNSAANDDAGNVLQRELIGKLNALYWLDSGHTGETDLWPTNHNLITPFLHTAGNCPPRLIAYITPFQYAKLDNQRDFRDFESILRDKPSPSLVSSFVLTKSPANLRTHFSLLNEFQVLQ